MSERLRTAVIVAVVIGGGALTGLALIYGGSPAALIMDAITVFATFKLGAFR